MVYELVKRKIFYLKLFISIYPYFLCVYHRYEVPFNTLDIDEIQTKTVNFGKIFNQLDKGLPSNKIVPECKATIDIIKEKVSM